MIVTITSGTQQSLIDAAASAGGTEACGLLLGRPGHIEAAIATANVAADPARSFEIDPAALLRLHREARGDGRAIIGHYHSHPNGDGRPSRRDAARASEDGQLWLIVAAGTVHVWRAVAPDPSALHGRFHPVTLAEPH